MIEDLKFKYQEKIRHNQEMIHSTQNVNYKLWSPNEMHDIFLEFLEDIKNLSGETVKFCEICPSCGSDDITDKENVNLCYKCDHVWMADE